MTTQDGPVQDGASEATDDARLTGIVEQIRADFLSGTAPDPAEMLATRLADAGMTLTPDQTAVAIAAITR